MRRYILPAVLLLAGLALLVQGRRLTAAADELVSLAEQNVRLAGQNRVYKSWLLEWMNEAMSGTLSQLNHAADSVALYMLVDTECPACERALRALEDGPSTLQVRVASYVDTRNDLLQWLESLHVSVPAVADDEEVASLERILPTSVTPVFIEMKWDSAVDITVGQPLERWLASRGRPR